MRRFDTRHDDLITVFDQKYRRFGSLAWGPKTRLRFGYFNPDDHYEALLSKLIDLGTNWLDVGCGHMIFPSNPDLAQELVIRCALVSGVDPDSNIHDNPYLTDAHNLTIEEFESEAIYDVVSLRMVAEHIANPESAIKKMGELARKGGYIVVYTPYKWAPVSLVARITPMSIHHKVKAWLWKTNERDTFPVKYLMNTRSSLKKYFEPEGFKEVYYSMLDDCRIFNRFRIANLIDLCIWKICQSTRIPYPERCILAVYQKK